MTAPRFQRAAENAADNIKHILGVIFRVAVFLLFAPLAFAAAGRGDWIAAGFWMLCAVGLGAVLS